MVTDLATREGPAIRRSLPRISPQTALVAVGVSYLVLQLTLFSLHRGASYDEAVYLAQVQPGAPNVFFGSWRARGITFLIAPVLLADGSLLAVRVFLAVASSAALTAAAWLWIPLVGWAAPVAAVIFGFSWPALFYGSEVMPNLWAAFLAFASVGYLARYLANPARRIDLMLVSVSLALMAVFRPLDAVPVAVAIAGYVLLLHRRSVRMLVPVAAGLALGWVPWLVEMLVRFGDPFLALYRARAAAKVGTASPGFHFSQNLALTNGPTLGPVINPDVPALGILWWSGLVLLVAVALVKTRKTPAFRTVVLSTVVGAALALLYLVFIADSAPRFLLPSYALLAIPAAVGLTALWSTRLLGRLAFVAALTTLAVWAGLQAATGDRIEGQSIAGRAVLQQVGSVVHGFADDTPCVIVSGGRLPQIQFASGCERRQLKVGTSARRYARHGDSVFLVVQTAAPPPGGWQLLYTVPGTIWRIYEPAPRNA